MAAPKSSPVAIDQKSVDRIIDSLTAEKEKLANSDPNARENLINQARELIAALESPLEQILRIVWDEPTRYFASRIAVDLNLFETLASNNGQPMTSSELAKPTGASPDLVERIARKLASSNIIGEAGPGSFIPNNLTRALAIPKYRDGIVFCYDAALPTWTSAPAFFAATHLANPTTSSAGPFQYASGGTDAFTWLSQRPRILQAFHAYVHAQRADRPSWTEPDFYPVAARLVAGLDTADAGRAALVDIGGGTGGMLLEFRRDVPEWEGRLVLQEIAPVVEHARREGVGEQGVEAVVHDFFGEQMVRGARGYFLRCVLHDWNDERAGVVLGRVRDAMEVGYSKLLINECVVGEERADWKHASLDMYMMALAASWERTERQWRELIGSVEGLRIEGIWSKGVGNESVIEVVRV